MIEGQLFTSLQWVDGVYKPVLHPILTTRGTPVTRGFPLKPRAGERPDHRHHVGNWLNYGNVNGFDFWGNGHSGERSKNGGEIKLKSVEKLAPGMGLGLVVTLASWSDPEEEEILTERTTYRFSGIGSTRIIDRIVTLTALDHPVLFHDTKEGMFAIRVARSLELPAEGEITLLDDQGMPARVTAPINEGITGNYQSSEGVTGLKVWGTRAKWMNLFGEIGNEKIALIICDHPKNPGYPTYWHARGYGLFSANPFGVKDFTQGNEMMNFSLSAKESVTLRYRLIIHSNSHLTEAEINALADDFIKKY